MEPDLNRDILFCKRQEIGGGFLLLIIGLVFVFARLPEMPPDDPETNALVDVKKNPQFETLTKNNYVNAVGKLALEMESRIWTIEDKLKGNKSRFVSEFEIETDEF